MSETVKMKRQLINLFLWSFRVKYLPNTNVENQLICIPNPVIFQVNNAN